MFERIKKAASGRKSLFLFKILRGSKAVSSILKRTMNALVNGSPTLYVVSVRSVTSPISNQLIAFLQYRL